jgi:hypothetical protein
LNFSEKFNRKYVFVFAAGWLGEWAGLLPLQESWLAYCITVRNIQTFGIARNSSFTGHQTPPIPKKFLSRMFSLNLSIIMVSLSNNVFKYVNNRQRESI